MTEKKTNNVVTQDNLREEILEIAHFFLLFLNRFFKKNRQNR